MNLKKISKVVATVLAVSLIAGCGGSKAPEAPAQSGDGGAQTEAPAASGGGSDFPGSKPVTLIVPWAAGGGSDVGARILQPYLEKELGATITVINPAGAAGWVGWEQLLAGNTDGYTFAMVNFPALFGGYMDKSFGRTKGLDDFTFLANHVSDDMVLMMNPKETRFNSVESFVEYAKSNEVSFGTTGMGSQGHMLMELINQDQGIELTQVPFGGFNDVKTALMGGHVDVGIGSVGEITVSHKDGELIGLAVFNSERSEFVDDIPTWEEKIGSPVYMASQRGFAVKAGVPAEIIEIFEKALEAAITNPEQVQKMAELGLKVDFISSADYTEHLKAFEGTVSELAGIMGWQ